MNITDGVMMYEGSITDKSEMKTAKNGNKYLSFSFSVKKNRKKDGKTVPESTVIAGLFAWGDMSYLVNEIAIGRKCILILVHDFKGGKHVINVRRILPLDIETMQRGWKAVDAAKAPEPVAEPDPIGEDDSDLPF